jgi:hypothetical protein
MSQPLGRHNVRDLTPEDVARGISPAMTQLH